MTGLKTPQGLRVVGKGGRSDAVRTSGNQPLVLTPDVISWVKERDEEWKREVARVLDRVGREREEKDKTIRILQNRVRVLTAPGGGGQSGNDSSEGALAYNEGREGDGEGGMEGRGRGSGRGVARSTSAGATVNVGGDSGGFMAAPLTEKEMQVR